SQNFQPTTQPTEYCVLRDFYQLRRPLAVPAVLYVVVKPFRGPLSRRRSRVRVSSSPPFIPMQLGAIGCLSSNPQLLHCCRHPQRAKKFALRGTCLISDFPCVYKSSAV